MKLYHGSNVKVADPKIIVSARTLDFGAGFYTTSDFQQARRWAHLQKERRKSGRPIVSVYEFSSEMVETRLNVKHFKTADKEWLEFVVANRKNSYVGQKYDLVIGPVADDNTMPVINDYMVGSISLETALLLLLPQKLVDQYAFLTNNGLSALRFLEAQND